MTIPAIRRPLLRDGLAQVGALLYDEETIFYEIFDRRKRSVVSGKRKVIVVEVRLQDGAASVDAPPGDWIPLSDLLDLRVLREADEALASPAP